MAAGDGRQDVAERLRGNIGVAAVDAGEVGLIGETDAEGDLGERQGGSGEEGPCSFDPGALEDF